MSQQQEGTNECDLKFLFDYDLKSPFERGLHKGKVIPSDSVTQLTHTEQNSVHVLSYTSQTAEFSSIPNGTDRTLYTA